MAGKVIITRPSDIGLKDLEIFYNPELLLYDGNDEEAVKYHFLKKTLLVGAVVANLNAPAENRLDSDIKIINKPAETTFVIEAVTNIEEATECIINDVQLILNKVRLVHFTNDEQTEIEIIDAYHNEVKRYYPSKNRIPF